MRENIYFMFNERYLLVYSGLVARILILLFFETMDELYKWRIKAVFLYYAKIYILLGGN